MTEGLLQQLTYRVVDQNTGTEIINPLPHPHQSSWSVMALQGGFPGGGTIGSFSIPLFAPSGATSEQYRAAKTLYDKLSFGQRIEGYLGNQAQGTPKFTGVLVDLQKSLSSFAITGYDSLWWLKSSLVLPGEQIPDTYKGPDILSAFKGTFELVFADDFSGSFGSLASNYTQTPAAQFTTTTDPNYNHTAVQCSTFNPSRAFLVSSTTGTIAQNQAAYVTAIGTIVSGNDTTDSGEMSVVVQSDSTGANCIFGRALMRFTTPTWAIDAEIWTNVAGTLTRVAQVQNIFTGLVNANFRCQVTMVGIVASNGHQFWRVLVNGKDSGCTYDQGGVATATRGVGITYGAVNSGGPPKVFVDALVWAYRNTTTPRFGAGTVAAGTQTLSQLITGQSQSQLDMWALALGLDAFFVRKNPGRGYKADTYDFSASPGTDLSGQVFFREGENIEDVILASASELYATDVRMAGMPAGTVSGADSGGVVVWPKIGQPGDMVLTDTVTDVTIPNFALLIKAAQQLQAVKVAPWGAKLLKVVRDPLTADKWRELDYVTLHVPSLNISNQKVQVLGYSWTENSLHQDIYLDQYATSASAIAAQRLMRSLEALGNIVSPR